MSDPIRDCPHGHMKGKCDTCELIEAEKTVTDNTAVIQTLEDKVLELAGEDMTKEASIAELESARKDWEHQKWLLEMELEGYKELCKAQELLLNNKSVAQ